MQRSWKGILGGGNAQHGSQKGTMLAEFEKQPNKKHGPCTGCKGGVAGGQEMRGSQD